MIKKQYIALIMAFVFAAMTCALPVEAASTKDTKKSTQTSSATKKSQKKSATVAKASGTKTTVAAKKTRGKSTAKNSASQAPAAKKSTKKKSVSKRSASRSTSQEIWMERASKSDMQTGVASWYGGQFHGGRTASGEAYDMHMFTAAHRTLPLGTVVKVIDEKSGDSVMVCINDRGPFIRGRVIDLSYAAAEQLGLDSRGVASVALEVITDAEGSPLNEDDAFYVDIVGDNADGKDFIGPFRQFADASVMQEVLREQHPKASIVVRPLASK